MPLRNSGSRTTQPSVTKVAPKLAPVLPKLRKPVLTSERSRREAEHERTKRREAAIEDDVGSLRRRGVTSAGIDSDEDDVLDLIDDTPEPEEAEIIDEEDEEGDGIVVREGCVSIQGRRIDPGPQIEDIEIRPCCGMCAKFVRIDAEERNDPEWEVRMLKRKDRCPLLFPRDQDLRSMDADEIAEVIPVADKDACKDFHFSVDHPRCSEALRELVESSRDNLAHGELQILTSTFSATLKLKAQEAKMGYRIGEIISVYDDNSKPCKAKVINFTKTKGREVIVTTTNRPGKQVRLAIPAKRAYLAEDD